jgi:hypothetical protein
MPRSGKKKNNGLEVFSTIIGGGSQSLSSPRFDDSLPSVTLDGGQSLMVKRAIASASRHGIELTQGRVNQGL